MKVLDKAVFEGQRPEFVSATVDYDGVCRIHTADRCDLKIYNGVWQPYSGDSVIVGYGFDTSKWSKEAIQYA